MPASRASSSWSWGNARFPRSLLERDPSEIGCILHEPVITRPDGVDSFDQWLGLGLDKHTIIADPCFVDPAKNDYTLKPDSPAFRLGFVPLDFSTVGLRGRPGAARVVCEGERAGAEAVRLV